MNKVCFKCKKEKGISNFYKHPQMKDGRVNKCKDCNKVDVINNRKKNIDYYRSYDRKRGNRQCAGYLRKYRESYPKKYKAHLIVNYAIRAGNLFREPCAICESTESVHAHHDDYSKPLNIRWLCAAHHRQWHEENGEGNNSK